jgi:SAM-dependent methyltransferase
MNLKDRLLRVRLFLLKKGFPGSNHFWINEYKTGGNSGPGSYGDLARFKAKVLNDFVKQNGIGTVFDFGCGDGNQLSLAQYKSYVGFDIAPGAIELCVDRFSNDGSKSFILFQPEFFKLGDNLLSDLSISLDVIFHLVEYEKYQLHLRQLFGSSQKWVVIYGIDSDSFFPEPYSKPRKFTSWVEANLPDWSLDSVVKNEYPVGSGVSSSLADFYIFRRTIDRLVA